MDKTITKDKFRILHTSDWHLGRSLYSRRRHDEFRSFLEYLADVILKKDIDLLLISGDIFDSSTPSNLSQEMYYSFLTRIAGQGNCQVVIIAGNHDSPSLLEATKGILKSLNIHVVGAISDNLEDEIITIKDEGGMPRAIVCAVPYLRERDIRRYRAGVSFQDAERELTEGIISHYQDVADLAEKRREELGMDIPILGMGHLYTHGGKVIDGDELRPLYVGSLAHVEPGEISAGFDYLALGHIHSAQAVGGNEFARYSGSPIAMTFKESDQKKSLCIVEFEGRKPLLELLELPVFRELLRISGDREQILERIDSLIIEGTDAWLEVEFTGESHIGDLMQSLETMVEDTDMRILCFKNSRLPDAAMDAEYDGEKLSELNPLDIFERLMDNKNTPEDEKDELRSAYHEILDMIQSEDKRAEKEGMEDENLEIKI